MILCSAMLYCHITRPLCKAAEKISIHCSEVENSYVYYYIFCTAINGITNMHEYIIFYKGGSVH